MSQHASVDILAMVDAEKRRLWNEGPICCHRTVKFLRNDIRAAIASSPEPLALTGVERAKVIEECAHWIETKTLLPHDTASVIAYSLRSALLSEKKG